VSYPAAYDTGLVLSSRTHLDIFPTVKAAIAGRRVLTGLAEVATGVAGRPAGHLLGRIRPPAATS
jgi:hypothetical protein